MTVIPEFVSSILLILVFAVWLRWLPRVKAAGWSTMSPLERNCAFWCESHRLALEALEAFKAGLK